MLNQKVVEIGSARNARAACQLPDVDFIRDLPDIPVLPETLLLMELAVRGRAVDLDRISDVILSDLGATSQVFRLAARECDTSTECPKRIEDCVSGLGLQACLEAMSKRTVTRSHQHSGVLDTWAHARDIAGISRFLAEQNGDSTPEDAYLAGLFHVLGSMPAMLGWGWVNRRSGDEYLAGLKIADAWSLPECVLEYFSDKQNREGQSRRTEIVERAHQLSIASSTPRPADYCFSLDVNSDVMQVVSPS